ncbi:Acidic fibroblast growth factor intracellular-binding protein, partial [Ooceraea biroi]
VSEVDAFISNYTLVDPEIYQLWVDGRKGNACSFRHVFLCGPIDFKMMGISLASDAVNILHQRGICQQTNAPLELVASDIHDHYRTYALLEKLLHTPTELASEQLAFRIEPQTSQMLIEMYHGITLKSCRRQYDNVKRVFKIVEDLPGSLVANIKQHFLLSEDLAKRYAAVVFIACLRLEMNKRKLQFLTFPDLYHCANSMMASWTYRCVGSEYFDTDLDREQVTGIVLYRRVISTLQNHVLSCMNCNRV